MTARVKTSRKTDELRAQARKALERERYFEAEEKMLQALKAARSAKDLQGMIDTVPTLRAARRGRIEQAASIGCVVILDEPIDEQAEPEPGCYLVQPPLVGADARRLRLAALEARVPLLVVCREPITQLGLCPIVAISPGTTLRTQIDPPDDLDAPDLPWLLGAIQQLGDWALATMDPDLDPLKRVEAIADYLTALPDHDELHEALVDACRAALSAIDE